MKPKEEDVVNRFLACFNFIMAKENKTAKELCEQLDEQPAYISMLRTSTNTKIRASLVASLIYYYLYINPLYILTGEGQMQVIPEDLKAILLRIEKTQDNIISKVIENFLEMKTGKGTITDLIKKIGKS